MITKKRNGAFTEIQFQNLVIEFIRNYDKLYDRNKRVAKDKNYAKSIFLNETLDAKIKEIQGKEPFYSFLQIITREDALTQASRFEIMRNFCIRNKYSIESMATGIAEYDAILSIYATITSDNAYEINSGYIFSCLEDNWGQFTREFLLSFEKALKKILIEKDIVTVKQLNKNEHPKLQDYYYNRYPRHLTEALDHENFPFPYYFLRVYIQPTIVTEDEFVKTLNTSKKGKISQKNKPFIPIGVVEYNSKCIATKYDTDDFDLFFALQLYFTDIFECTQFLKYHFVNSFENEYQEYKEFLENLSIKYNFFLKDKHSIMIDRFITENDKGNSVKTPIKENKGVSNIKQILAIKCLIEIVFELSERKFDDVPKTKIADFIQFITQLETANKNIRSTNLYDIVRESNLLLNKNKENAISEWEFLKKEFEKIELKVATDKVNDVIDEIKRRKR